MQGSTTPFALPQRLPPELARASHYWEELKRGENIMPFWDDVSISSLSDQSGSLMLVDVFQRPQRFRLSTVGDQIAIRYHASIAGRFADELQIKVPLNYFLAQSSVTVEARAPTFYNHEQDQHAAAAGSGYSRLMLPLWGDGHVRMLLVAFSFQEEQ